MNRHLSSEEISQWMIGERTPESELHARDCSACRAEIGRVQNAFSLFRESGRRWSDHVYAGSPHAAKPARPFLPWAGALAASVLLAAAMLLRPVPAPPTESRAEEPFLAFPYVAPMAPYERAAITRMDVPVAALIAAGFEVHVPDVGASVKADVVFGQDGRAHAIRLVSERVSETVSQRSEGPNNFR